MLKFLSQLGNRIKASERPERKDAARIYAKVMKQARNPVFYAPGLVEDTTDGRMEWLTAHLSVIVHALQKHGEDGAKLSQAIYDTMVDDFDVALREEGLSDSGVKHRIKPLAKMFLTRARTYASALEGGSETLSDDISKHVLSEEPKAADVDRMTSYIRSYSTVMQALTLDQFASGQFDFPSFNT